MEFHSKYDQLVRGTVRGKYEQIVMSLNIYCESRIQDSLFDSTKRNCYLKFSSFLAFLLVQNSMLKKNNFIPMEAPIVDPTNHKVIKSRR